MNVMRQTKTRNRKAAGEAFVEVLLGAFVLVPIALGILDLSFLAIANSANDNLARNAARAAANQQNSNGALDAANKVVDAFPLSKVIPEVTLVQPIAYSPTSQVTVKTVINVQLPVAIPGVNSNLTFIAQDTEACVGMPVTN